MSTAARPAHGATRTKREQQGDRSREEILDAAEQLMSTKGYAATSISDLARESGLPTSSIYWHFNSKSGVLGAVMERGAQRFFQDSNRLMAAVSGDDPRSQLRTALGGSDRLVRAHPQFLRLFLLLLLGSEGSHDQEAAVKRVRREGRRRLTENLRIAYQPWGAEVADRIAEELGDVALMMFDGYFIAIEAGPTRARAKLMDQMVTTLHALAEQVRAAHPSPPRTR